MKPLETIDSCRTPDGGLLELLRHDRDWFINLDRYELMGSREHGTEDSLGALGCEGFKNRPGIRVLVGGLGLGYTLRAALDACGPDAEVVVAELMPEVVRWNEAHLSHLAGHPLKDRRAKLYVGDVYDQIRGQIDAWDAMLLDVDNGPTAFTMGANAKIYDKDGIDACRAALREGGRLAVWATDRDIRYERKLASRGFTVTWHPVRGRMMKGGHHTVWVAKKTRGAVPRQQEKKRRR